MMLIIIIIIIIIFHHYIVLTYYVPGTNSGILHQVTLKNPDDRGILSLFLQKSKLKIE